MSDVTRILSQIDAADPQAAEQLLPLVYDELRKLAVAKLAHQVHLRLMSSGRKGLASGSEPNQVVNQNRHDGERVREFCSPGQTLFVSALGSSI